MQLALVLEGVVAQRLGVKKGGQGRVPAIELMIKTPTIKDMIREGKTHQIEGTLQSSSDMQGTLGFDNCLFRLAKERLVTSDEAVAFARIPDALRRRLSEMPRDDQ